MNSIKILIISLFGVSTSIFVLLFSIENIGSGAQIYFEAESASNVVKPLYRIKNESASGGEAIVARGESHKVDGYAKYILDIPTSENYQFWARCFWPGGCSNSFKIRVGNSKKFFFGNDGIRDKWHWVKGPLFSLNKGENNLTIWNEEFGALVDKILITSDTYFIPTGIGDNGEYYANFENESAKKFKPKSIKRWNVQADIALDELPSFLTWQNIKNPTELARKLRNPNDLFSKLIKNQFIKEYLYEVDLRNTFNLSQPFIKSITSELNKTIQTQNLENFFNVSLTDDQVRQIAQNSSEKKFELTNRLLLETVYSNEIGSNKAYYLSSYPGGGEYSILDKICPKEFALNIKFKFVKSYSANRNVKIFFNFINQNNYYCVNFYNKQVDIALVKDGVYKEITNTLNTDLNIKNEYNSTTLIRNGQEITLKLDGQSILSTKDSILSGGKVGVGSDIGDVFFDDIELITNFDPVYENNFFEPDWNSNGEWAIISGKWFHNKGLKLGTITGRKSNNIPASIVLGEDFWKDYSYRIAFKAKDFGEVGLCFNYQNNNNYYIFKWNTGKSNSTMSLSKVKSGIKVDFLKKNSSGFLKDNWYKLEIRRLNQKIHAYVDDKKIFDIIDSTFSYGKVALWLNSNNKVEFSCIKVSPTKTLELVSPTDYNYTFEIREQSAIDFADWIPISNRNHINYLGIDNVDISKDVFDKIYLLSKKQFSQNISFSLSLENRIMLNKNIPSDLNIHLFIYEKSNVSPCIYEFIVNQSEISLLKNNHLLKKVNSRFIIMNDFEVYFQNNRLELRVDNRKALKYNINHNLKNFQLGFGVGGASKALIDVKEVSIKTNEHKTF